MSGNVKQLSLPLSQADINTLCVGDVCRVSGVMYTARDAAHARLCAMLDAGEPLPVELDGICIYYAGPCPAAPGEVIGPCGPTTSSRMDAYAPRLIGLGQTAMIGKGKRSDDVKRAMLGRAVYFAATGGAGLLIAKCIKEAELCAFPDLGPEAIWRLKVEDMPVIVAIDAEGNDITR